MNEVTKNMKLEKKKVTAIERNLSLVSIQERLEQIAQVEREERRKSRRETRELRGLKEAFMWRGPRTEEE